MGKAMTCGHAAQAFVGGHMFPEAPLSCEQFHQEVIPTVFDGEIGGVVVRPIKVTPGNAKN